MFSKIFKHLNKNKRFVSCFQNNLMNRKFSHNLNDKSFAKLSDRQNISDLNAFVNRTHTCGQLSDQDIGQRVRLCGWIQYQRLGKFVTLRDSYGLTQIIVLNDKRMQKTISKLMPESVVEIGGQVVGRPLKDINPKLKTGAIEVIAEELNVLNVCRNDIPFIIRDYSNVNEKTRLEFRYIDLRHPRMQTILRLRSKVVNEMRRFLTDNYGFVEVETPTLFKATPGGAKEFVVPTQFEGRFYNLVQSPQQFKQLLMIGGIDRYFQIARCYRDEGTKPDRQPEFTQLDLEISFTNSEGVMSLIERLLEYCWPTLEKIKIPFQTMTYSDAIKNYGTDKPDLRTEDNDLAFVWITDFPLFLPNDEKTCIESSHHPFTAPQPQDKQLLYSDPLSVKGQHYDLVLNGQEVGGGSIRVHDYQMQEYILRDILKADTESMQYFLDALRSGCPPHGGIALGLDRLISIMCSTDSIRDVMAFPKSANGKDLMAGSPSPIPNGVKQLYHLKGRRVYDHTNELPLPELIGASDILSEELRRKICKHLPARAEGYAWTLIYSSSKHGFSLKTMYREMIKYETPVLMVIEDTFGTIFGALISCSLRVSEHFYGTGETFLFTFQPDSQLQVFPWTGENLFFVKGDQDSISIGAGDGNFGLWLDGDLFHGRSHPCKTFGNSSLSIEEDFVVKALECWGFV